MTEATYNAITLSIIAIVFICFIILLVSAVMTIVRWRRAERRLHLRNAVFSIATGIVLVAVHRGIAELLFWPAVAKRSADSKLLKTGDFVPPYSLRTLNGDLVTLGPDQKDVVVLDFFATWCGPCCAELPYLQKFWDSMANKNNLHIVVVGREQTEDELAAFRNKNGYTLDFAADPSRELFDMYATHAIPRTVVVGPGGKVLADHASFQPDQLPSMRSILPPQCFLSE